MQACILIIPSFYINPLYHRESVKYLKWSSCFCCMEKKKKKTNKDLDLSYPYDRVLLVSSHEAEKQSIWRGSHSLSIRDEDITFFFFFRWGREVNSDHLFQPSKQLMKVQANSLSVSAQKKEKKKDLQYHQRERVKQKNECSTPICEKTNTVKRHSRTTALE